MKTRSPLGLILALAFTSASLLACGGNHATADAPDAGPIAECEAFLASYERCLDSLGPADIARARVEQTRAGLAAQAEAGGTSRAALRQTCAENLAQLGTSCR